MKEVVLYGKSYNVDIKIFYLWDSEITEICKEIGLLINLKYLDFSYNKITKICKEIGKLINLITFYLCNNKITEICKEIDKLINLEALYLSNNNITEICKEIGNLVELKYLDLGNNNIQKTTEIFQSMQYMRRLINVIAKTNDNIPLINYIKRINKRGHEYIRRLYEL